MISDHLQVISGADAEAGITRAGITSADERPRVLDEAQRRDVAHRASRGLIRALLAQAATAGLVIVVAGLVSGTAAAVSALLGAAAYFVPNALFAMRLLFGVFAVARPGPAAFLWGQAFKLVSATLLLGLFVWMGRDWLVWPALLFGLLGVLKGYVLLLALRRLP